MIQYKVDLSKYVKYFPKCTNHGGLLQIEASVGKYEWICKEKLCRSRAFGLTDNKFIEMLEDSGNFEEKFSEEAKREIAKTLSYFPSIQKAKVSLIIEAVFNEGLSFINSWTETIELFKIKIEDLIKKEIKELKKEYDRNAYLDKASVENRRVCRLCGLTSCKDLNNCMETSD
tara:strand:- start:3902 stop:4420 length:519 start_codon:yes stop_codon:yes gene_type:complete